MFLSGTNFVLSYFAFTKRFQKIFADDEFRLYVRFIGFFTLLVVSMIFVNQYAQNLFSFKSVEPTFRSAVFQIVSIITTTGLCYCRFTQWTPLITIVFFGLMFLGGSSGSTAGGVKVVRHMLMIKSGFLEFKRALHPNAIIQARYNDKS